MADLSITNAAVLAGAGLASGDLFPVLDVSAASGSKGSRITAEELGIGLRAVGGFGTISTQDADNVTLTGGTINGAVIGGVTPVAGSFTTLASSVNGAASTPAMRLSGTIFSGGSASTTQPLLLIMPTGTSWTNGNTSGTALGVNAVSGFGGNLLDLQTNNSRAFVVDRIGQCAFTTSMNGPSFWENTANSFWTASTAGGAQTKAAGYFGFSSTSNAYDTADVILRRKAAATLQLGTDAAGVTNQMLTAANRITSDGVGADLTIAPGNGRGGAGGSLILATFTTEGAGTPGALTSRWFLSPATGHLLASTTNSCDIGAAAGNKPRNVWLAGNLDCNFVTAASGFIAGASSGATAGPFTTITSITVVGGIVTDLQGS